MKALHIYDKISLKSSFNLSPFSHFLEKIKANIICSLNSFWKLCVLWDNNKNMIKRERGRAETAIKYGARALDAG